MQNTIYLNEVCPAIHLMYRLGGYQSVCINRCLAVFFLQEVTVQKNGHNQNYI